MALKELQKSVKVMPNKLEQKAQEFIFKENAEKDSNKTNQDHRLTLRIPKRLMCKLDEKRKQRIGSISRNQWILEQLERVVK